MRVKQQIRINSLDFHRLLRVAGRIVPGSSWGTSATLHDSENDFAVAPQGSDGFGLSSKDMPVLCVISPNRDAYSETFIRAHVERLPATIKLLYGGFFPRYEWGDRELLPWTRFRRLTRGVLRRTLRLPEDHFKKEALRRVLVRNRVRAVLAEYGPTGVAVMDVCKEADVPLIVHFHGFDVNNREILGTTGQQYPELFSNAAGVIAVSRDMERKLLDLGADPQKLHYNPCGVDTSLFHGADPAQAAPLFVAVGRFVDIKGPHLTILAFSRVVHRIPEARLVMMGDGPLWDACKQLTHGLNIAEAVELPGVRPHLEVAAAMHRARAFVQHSMGCSYVDSEGTPVAVLEAGAAGLPVVSTRNGGIRDVVIDGETGFLVDEGDVDGMADRMLQVAEDPALAARLGKGARERVCAEFSMEASIGNLWHIIETAIRKHHKSQPVSS